MSINSEQSNARLIVCAGPRLTEKRLLADVSAAIEQAKKNPALLQRPVLVVVRSRALRDQIATLVARQLGPAVLGISVQTLQATAADVLRCCRVPLALDNGLASVLARRYAEREEKLREVLADFEDGYGVAAAAIRDFQSAGLGTDPKQLQNVVAEISRAPGRAKEKARAEAIARATHECAKALEREFRVGRHEDRVALAAQLLEDHGAEALPARAVFVHGYADATGKATNLLCALARQCNAQIYLDEPADPVASESGERVTAFTTRLRRRLAEVAALESDASNARPPKIRVFNASGAGAEIREVARRVRELLNAGVRAEDIGLVARQLESYFPDIRREFSDLGVPFGGVQLPQSYMPAGRRARAVIRLIEDGPAASLDSWLGAGAREVPHAMELTLGLRSLGVVRISQLTELRLEEVGASRGLGLPIRKGFVAREGEDGQPYRAKRFWLSAEALRAAQKSARELDQLLSKWPQKMTVSEHVAKARTLLVDQLGWPDKRADLNEAVLVERLETLPGQDQLLAREEFFDLLVGQLENEGRVPLGGRDAKGGGVQVIDADHAAGLTFDHLFVVGLNAGVFPRTITEDPIVEDAIRRELLSVLPDLSLKRRGYDEEAHLFAQLLDAAPAVTLSWQRADAEGKLKEISPLLDRLIIERKETEPVKEIPRLQSIALCGQWAGGRARPRTARESLRLAALSGTRKQWSTLLPPALESRGESLGTPANARLTILEEKDPLPFTPEGKRRLAQLGPWSGLVAPVSDAADPRAGALFITWLESMARCPWRTFLQNVLRIEPAPDPAAAPEIESRLIGLVVHTVLEKIVETEGQRPDGLAVAIEQGVREVGRPEWKQVQKLAQQVARTHALESALTLPGIHRTLAERSLPFVRRALEIDWPSEDSRVSVVGAELRIDTFIEDHRGERRRISFIADRVDLREGRLILTDYKTGKPVSDKVRHETRLRHLRAAVSEGRRLQVAAYARTPHEGGAVGRYLFVDEQLGRHLAEAGLGHDDPVVSEAFPELAKVLLEGWDEGVFFPRVEDEKGKTPAACGYCDFASACVQGEYLEHERLRAGALSGLEESDTPNQRLARLWWLGGLPSTENRSEDEG